MSRCWPCDYSHICVPREVAWLPPTHPNYTAEGSLSGLVLSYWERTEEKCAGKDMRSSCGLERQSAVDTLIRAMHHAHRRGMFLVWRGDSFMRISFMTLFKQIVQQEAVLARAHFNYSTYHLDHLLCCSADEASTAFSHGDLPAARRLFGAKCFVDFTSDLIGVRLRERLDAGQLCLMWKNEPILRDYTYVRSLAPYEPAMVTVNGGLHYSRGDLGPLHRRPSLEHNFTTHMQGWVNATAHAIVRDTRLHDTAIVFITSPVSFTRAPHGWQGNEAWRQSTVHWDRELRRLLPRFAHANRTRRPAAASLNFIDLEALAAVDRCGISHRFPARKFKWLAPPGDACGNRFSAIDPHYVGGAYEHLVELELGVLASSRPLCPPPPFVPWNSTFNNFSTAAEEAADFAAEAAAVSTILLAQQ